MHNGAFRVCVLARSHVVDHRTRTCIGKHVVNVGVHSCLRIISSWLFLFLLLFSFLLSLALSFSPLSLSHPSSTDHVREGILSSFYSLSRPVIVDTMARNDCFTPPLARELGNKLAAGLISLSRSMTAPPRLRRQGLMSEGVSRPDAGPEDTVEIVSRRTAGSARSLTRSAASLKTGQFRLKRRRGGKVRGAGTSPSSRNRDSHSCN